jgi:hypothetical protein
MATLQERRLGYHSRAGLEPGTSRFSTLRLNHYAARGMYMERKRHDCNAITVLYHTCYNMYSVTSHMLCWIMLCWINLLCSTTYTYAVLALYAMLDQSAVLYHIYMLYYTFGVKSGCM